MYRQKKKNQHTRQLTSRKTNPRFSQYGSRARILLIELATMTFIR